ncbi:MAG: hypothetical protein ACFHVJ_01850 [Aestuariibacter sp.]
MDSIIEKLNENLQVIYRKGIDADRALDLLKSQGKGKHQAIFPEDSGFVTQSERFMPYIEELSNNIQELDHIPEKDKEQSLALIVRKMETLFTTLANLQQVLSK